MDCEEWLDDTQTKLFEVVKENFGGAQQVGLLPEGTRTIIVWNNTNRRVKVVLSCIETIVMDNKDDVLLTPKTGPSKSEIYEKIAAAFQKGAS